MAVIRLGPEVNCLALVDLADAKRMPMARPCERCGETHHPRDDLAAGARYPLKLDEDAHKWRWLCVACYTLEVREPVVK